MNETFENLYTDERYGIIEHVARVAENKTYFIECSYIRTNNGATMFDIGLFEKVTHKRCSHVSLFPDQVESLRNVLNGIEIIGKGE